MRMQFGFSIDVEDGISLAMRDFFKKPIPQTNQVDRCTKLILDLLDKNQTTATFFILGQVAKKFPSLVKEISDKGHEIAVHGYNHIRFDQMDSKIARRELSEAKSVLEDLSGVEVIGHRAPAFSIGPSESWAFDVISEVGFKYDSSIMPVRSLNYGWDGFEKEITKLKTHSGNTIWEIPLSTTGLLGKTIPFSGGSYLRLAPLKFLKWAFDKESKNQNVILYIHPYELDTIKYPDYYFEELKGVPLMTNIKLRSNWINRGKVENKLNQLLIRYDFVPMKSIMNDAARRNETTILDINNFITDI